MLCWQWHTCNKQQTVGSDNHYIQDEGCGRYYLCPWPVNSSENTVFLLLLLTGALQIPCLNHPEDDNYEEIRQFFILFLHCVYPSKGGGEGNRGWWQGKNKRVEECELWGSGKSNRKEERVEKLGIDQTTINTISQRVKRDNFQSVDFSHFLLIGRYT